MSARLRALARQTQEIVDRGGYRAPGGHEVPLAAAIEAARAGTRMYGPEPVRLEEADEVDGPARRAGGHAPAPVAVEVTGESSLEAARRLVPAADDEVAVLNFASARNPGGGFLNGAQAQEEALCRSSALYACLRGVRPFYDHHREHRDPLYTHRVIHSPGVPVFREDDGFRGDDGFREDDGRLLDAPYRVAFLTAAAPNAGVLRSRAPERAAEVPRALVARAERVLEVAALHGHRRLVLGAWGCGVFRNDPAEVAAAFRGHLTGGGRFTHRFDRVVFAVLDRTPGAGVRGAFARAFA
ncbi:MULTISPECIES: TIGR02452 family protein [Streptomyces]|uniref:TIGR02452 family protein n=1 Tax=Streptomyces TaxID=1883 RepID=UPI00178612F6|nr:TIGR02452 family protein [Streptomyces sp. ME02-6978.2a]MDX3358989.1 TIGR02452 family protein [Streptomyces sp. ME02-6978.2a]GHE61751.1 TIGR02452 family protein [Streptomyces griseoaurantiacus]